jgi:sulfate/thiosulfate transport system permease protein
VADSGGAAVGGSSRTARIGLRTVVVGYLGILVLVPLAVVLWRTFEPGLAAFLHAVGDPDTQHALRLTAVIAVWAVVINTVFGVIVALLLVRYRFPGQRLLSAFVDLPVSISPIVVGLALVLVYGNQGWFGSSLERIGLTVVNAAPAMVLATVFVSLPLVVRAVAPVLEQSGVEQEQAARSLGAGGFTQFRRITLPTIRAALAYGVVLSLARSLGANAAQRFVRITLPTIRVALAYGTVLSIARCLGEYGAVLVVSGNISGQTETATLRIDNLYEYDTTSGARSAAYAVTFVLVAAAVLAIVAMTILRRRQVST